MKKTVSILLVIACLVGAFSSFATVASAKETFAQVNEASEVTLWNAATGEVLNFDNGVLKNGTPVRVWPLDGTSEQIWKIVKVKGTTYRLVTAKSAKYCLDVYRGNAKLKAGQKCDVWKTGDDATAQDLVFTLCANGNYVIRMAENPGLALAASDSKGRVKLVKYDSTSKAQQWSIRDAKGNKLGAEEAPTGIPESYYKKSGRYYVVDGVKCYEAITLRDYNGVKSGSLFFVKENGVIVTDAAQLEKLGFLDMFENMREGLRSAVAVKVSAASDYYSVCTEVANTEKLGAIYGKATGIGLSIYAGNVFKIADAVISVAEETLSPEAVKTIAFIGMLRVYSNNTVAYGTKFLKNAKDTVTDYATAKECLDLYFECMANFDAVVYLGGDIIKEMSDSSFLKELFKNTKNIVLGFADSVIPNIKSVEIAKYVTDGVISVAEFAEKSGAKKAYCSALEKYGKKYNVDFSLPKSIGEKLSEPLAIKFVKPLVSGGKTNVTTQKWGNRYTANKKYHLGVDLGTNGGKSTTVVAIAGGVVVRTVGEKKSGGWGNLVIVEHTTPDGRKFYSGYGHLESIYVKVGDKVEEGRALGLMGNTGNSTGAHLHLLVFSGKLGKNSVPLGYTASKISGNSIKVSGITYYNPLEVIATQGAIIK